MVRKIRLAIIKFLLRFEPNYILQEVKEDGEFYYLNYKDMWKVSRSVEKQNRAIQVARKNGKSQALKEAISIRLTEAQKTRMNDLSRAFYPISELEESLIEKEIKK